MGTDSEKVISEDKTMVEEKDIRSGLRAQADSGSRKRPLQMAGFVKESLSEPLGGGGGSPGQGPDSFPSIPHSIAKLLRGTSESEMVELFGKFLNTPMLEASVVGLHPDENPMPTGGGLEVATGLGASRLRALPIGESGYERMCATCMAGWPNQAGEHV